MHQTFQFGPKVADPEITAQLPYPMRYKKVCSFRTEQTDSCNNHFIPRGFMQMSILKQVLTCASWKPEIKQVHGLVSKFFFPPARLQQP